MHFKTIKGLILNTEFTPNRDDIMDLSWIGQYINGVIEYCGSNAVLHIEITTAAYNNKLVNKWKLER